MYHRILLAVVMPLVCCCVDLYAQTVDSTKTYHIEEVSVSAQRIRKEVIPVQMLAGEELQKLSVHSVADAIRYFSGIQIKDYGGIGGLKTVNIRGLGTQHVGVFYDGVQLGNAQNGQIDLGRFSLDNMEAVSLYNGQKSAIFQSAKDFASAGSIYMTARHPSFGEGQNYRLKGTFKTGSFGLVNPSVLLEHRLSKQVSGSLSAEYMYTSGKYKFRYRQKNGYDITETRKNGDVEAIRAEYGLFGDMQGGEWKAKAYLYNSGDCPVPLCVRRVTLCMKTANGIRTSFCRALSGNIGETTVYRRMVSMLTIIFIICPIRAWMLLQCM